MNPPSFQDAVNGSGGNLQANLSRDVANLTPLATTYHGAQYGVPIAQTVNKSFSGGGSGISKFAHFLGGVAGEIGHVTAGAANWLGTNLVHMVTSPIKFGDSTYHAAVDAIHVHQQNSQIDQLNGQRQKLYSDWKSNRITTAQFKAGLKDIVNAQDSLSKQINDTANNVAYDTGVIKSTALDTAASLITLATAGFLAPEMSAAEKAASVFVQGAKADPALLKGASAMARFATSPELFADLSPGMQSALQRAVAEVVVNTPIKMSAGQVARSAAVNLALKYPIYFNYASGTGHQIYNELDNAKYGDSVRTIAFNAALLLSGGPIGWALEKGGAAVGGLTARTFGQTAFWDELSKFYGNGANDGFYQAATKIASKMAPEERDAFYKNLSAVEATNLNATSGDVVAAAHRVASGTAELRGAVDLTDLTHEEGLMDMVNFAKNQKLASEIGKSKGLGELTVGRVDARDLNSIAGKLTTAEKDSRLSVWHDLVQNNPNQAWAVNANFNKQIENLISKYDNPSELDNAIRNIKAQFSVKGFPEGIAKQMAKEGYFPIKPVDIQAPYKEGSGVLGSKFAGAEDFWTKTVQPLPILDSIGATLTNLGLSPYASTQRVYQMFNENLAKNLEEAGVAKKIMGEDISQTTDSMIKQLSSYAHEPQAGRIFSRVPISDLRQLTKTDIEKALGVSRADAADIQKAIASAMIQVPLAARGLGDRAVDIAYPALRRYLRTQGALRFSWNPFFQYLRLIPKTEFLSEVQGGGVFASMFAGRLGNINKIRTLLREEGAFEAKAARGSVLSGEAVDAAGAGTSNLTKKLLPMQERSIAGLIDAQAQRMGMDYQTYIKTFPEQVRDTIQAIAQYDRHSQFLNSPLMRTLNVAFFPLRFETKVAQIMARSLSKTSLLTQVSVIKGLMSAHTWLNSPEGQAWYSKNADAIGLMGYISPLTSMSDLFMHLVPGHDHSLGNFGELGGLPFGWIPQLLDAEGLTHFNAPSVNAKTGEVFPSYVPASDKGQLAIAIQDFIGSLFSYPGATVGLPSKASITRFAALSITGANKKTDLKLNTPPESALSPEQQSFQQVVQQMNGTQAQLAPTPTQQSVTGVRVPAGSTPLTVPHPKAVRSGSGRKKKTDFRPYLLPGQSKLGQL